MDDHDDDLDRVGNAYLEHLTAADLVALVQADSDTAPAGTDTGRADTNTEGIPPAADAAPATPAPAATDAGRAPRTPTPPELAAGSDRSPETMARIRALRHSPSLVLDVLDRRHTSARILNLVADRSRPRIALISPFLLFAAAIHRTAADLMVTTFAPERTGPRLRVPVFDSGQLAAYLALPRRRLFLAELLASFARGSSGIAVTRTPAGIRRRRWDELDLTHLAVLLDAVGTDQRPGVWRRLGDLALLQAGMFADGAEHTAPDPVQATRLALQTGIGHPVPELAAMDLLEWLGTSWYRLAAGRLVPATATAESLRDNAEHFHQARRVLNATADRYLYPISVGWFDHRR